MKTNNEGVLMYLEVPNGAKPWLVQMTAHISPYQLGRMQSKLEDYDRESLRSGDVLEQLILNVMKYAWVSQASMIQVKRETEMYSTASHGSIDHDEILDGGPTAQDSHTNRGEQEKEEAVGDDAGEAEDGGPPPKRKRVWKVKCGTIDDVDGDRPLMRYAPASSNAVLAGFVEVALPSNWSDPREVLGPGIKLDFFEECLITDLSEDVRRRINEVRTYLVDVSANHKVRARRCVTEMTLILAAVFVVTWPKVIDMYRESKGCALSWTAQRHGVYETDGQLNQHAVDMAQYLGLDIPRFTPETLARNSGSKDCNVVADAVLREDALRSAWPILGGDGLKLPACKRNCALMSFCYTCGVGVQLFVDIVEDQRVDLLNLPTMMLRRVEPAWGAFNHRKDLRTSPMFSESTLEHARCALKAVGQPDFNVSGFGKGLTRLGKSYPYDVCILCGSLAMRKCLVLNYQLCEPCATRCGSRDVVDCKGKDTVVVEHQLKRSSFNGGTLRSTLPGRVFVDVVGGGLDDSLGIIVEVRVPKKPLSQTRGKKPEADDMYVTMEVTSIMAGGKVDLHNSMPDSLKIHWKDLAVSVCGCVNYVEAKAKLLSSEPGIVRFVVAERSGVDFGDLEEKLRPYQSRPSDAVYSPHWNLANVVHQCHHPGCKRVLKWSCPMCEEN